MLYIMILAAAVVKTFSHSFWEAIPYFTHSFTLKNLLFMWHKFEQCVWKAMLIALKCFCFITYFLFCVKNMLSLFHEKTNFKTLKLKLYFWFIKLLICITKNFLPYSNQLYSVIHRYMIIALFYDDIDSFYVQIFDQQNFFSICILRSDLIFVTINNI